MSTDPFDELLELENDYYQEGYDAGVADSTYAGMIEGKVFGIEKGYEKAVELGKLHGRALVWQERTRPHDTAGKEQKNPPTTNDSATLRSILQRLPSLSDNARLQRQVESLLSSSDSSNTAKDNSDGAVTDFDDRIARSKAKAKVVANTTREELDPGSSTNTGIEDATGLQARH